MELTKCIDNLVQVVHRESSLDQCLDALIGTPDSPGDLVHILWLDNRLQIILKQLGEVVYCRG